MPKSSSKKYLSGNQFNQKFKLMIEGLEAPGYVIYSNTPPHTRALWTTCVDATQTLLIPGAKIFHYE